MTKKKKGKRDPPIQVLPVAKRTNPARIWICHS